MLTEARLPTVNSDRLPAGGPDPARFDWQEVWYPVAYLQDLDKAKLTKFTLLGRDLVIWWDRNAACWRTFVDQCPHRLVPLSEGRVAEDGLLECPYHGWAFRGDGACDRIPQQVPGNCAHESKRACALSLPTAERQGLLFVYPGQPDNADRVTIPLIEPMEEDPEGWICLNTFRDLPYDALTLMENVLDSSHVPFTHHRSLSDRANASPVELEVLEAGKQGFSGFWQDGPRKGTLGSQSSRFIAPNLMWHDLTAKQLGRTLTVVYATPIRKGECRLFARFPFKFASKLPGFFMKLTPQWSAHLNQHKILEDDQIFLHYQERYLAEKGGSANFAKAFYLPTRADSFVAALRKWVNDYDADPFPGEGFPVLLSKTALLDRYQSHTLHCASCRTALANVQRLRLGIAIVGTIVWASLPLLALLFSLSPWVMATLSLMIAIVAGAAWLRLGKLEQEFYHGREIPPRNLP